MTESSRPHGRIAAFFGKLVFVASLAATVLVSGILVFIEYRHGMDQIEEHLGIVAQSHASAIAAHLGRNDQNGLRHGLYTIVAIPHLAWAEVRRADGTVLAQAGTTPDAATAIRRAYPLTDQGIPVGTLDVAADRDTVYEHMRETAGIVIPFNAAWTLALAGLIFLRARERIARPLETLARHAREFKTDDLYAPLRLPGRHAGAPYEIDELETALNAMRLRLRATHMEDQSRAADLEAAIHQRTKYLEVSERRLRDAQTIGRIGSWDRDLVTDKGYWSDELYRIYGFTPNEIEPTIQNFLSILHPEDRDLYKAVRESAFAGTAPFDTELRITRPDGERRRVHMRADIERDAAGRAIRAIGTVQDITERAELEQARRDAEMFAQRAVEYLADALIVIGPDGIIRRVNPAAERMFGHAARDMIGGNVNMLMPEPYRSEHDGYLARYRQTGRTNIIGQGRELVARRKDGAVFPVDLTVAEMKGGRERLFIATLRDLTERKKIERELVEAARQAALSDRAKKDFLAIMGHELRTPLNVVLGYADLMRMRTFGPIDNPRYVEYLDIIHASGAHLLDLINDILDMSAIETGTLTLREEILEAPALCRDTIRLVGPRADKGGVRVENRCPDGLPLLTADARRLKQILLNVLSNAVKFTPTGGHAAITARLDADRSMVFEIVDTGIGMTEDEAVRALEPFGQTDTRLSRAYEGAGLGLPLAQSLIALHGGALSIRSAPGQGTTVTVRLPPERTCEMR